MLKFYADESRDPKTSLIFAAGLLMTGPQAMSLEADVKRALGSLPYFHMREGHAKQYPDIYAALKKLIVRGRVLFGVSGSISEREHNALLSRRLNGQKLSTWMGKPYTYLMGHTMRTAATAVDYLHLGSSVKSITPLKLGTPIRVMQSSSGVNYRAGDFLKRLRTIAMRVTTS